MVKNEFSLIQQLALFLIIHIHHIQYTVKPVYNDHLKDPKTVGAVDKRLSFRGHLCFKSSKWDLKIVAMG